MDVGSERDHGSGWNAIGVDNVCSRRNLVRSAGDGTKGAGSVVFRVGSPRTQRRLVPFGRVRFTTEQLRLDATSIVRRIDRGGSTGFSHTEIRSRRLRRLLSRRSCAVER
jgi:hypothetical protein